MNNQATSIRRQSDPRELSHQPQEDEVSVYRTGNHFHYGDRITEMGTGKNYLVRAAAPGLCYVICAFEHGLERELPDWALRIIKGKEIQGFNLYTKQTVI